MQRLDTREKRLFDIVNDEKLNEIELKKYIGSILRTREQIKKEYEELKIEFKEQDIVPSINIKNAAGDTLLDIAATKGHANALTLLLEAKADPSLAPKALLHAAKGNHKACTRILLDAKADCRVQDDEKNTPLHYCTDFGDEDSVRLLIEAKADLDAFNNQSRTPLLIAASKHPNIVHLLLCAGANDKLANNLSHVPLHYAADSGNLDCIKLLVTDETVNFLDVKHTTPLYAAAYKGYTKAVRLLLDKGADPNIGTAEHNTPLHVAINLGHTECALFLSSLRTINLDARGPFSSTALRDAAAKGHAKIVHALLKAGANTTLSDNKGDTPLHWAAFKGHLECVKLLSAETKNLNPINSLRETPAECAFNRSHYDCLALLLERGATAPINIPLETPKGICESLHLFCLGVLIEQTSGLWSALACYERSDYPDAYYRLSGYFLKQGDTRRAIHQLSNAIQTGHLLAPSRLLAISEQYIPTVILETKAEKKEEKEDHAETIKLCSAIYPHLSFLSELTASQWQQLALMVLAEPGSFRNVMDAYLFASEAAIRAAELTAPRLNQLEEKELTATTELISAEIELEKLEAKLALTKPVLSETKPATDLAIQLEVAKKEVKLAKKNKLDITIQKRECQQDLIFAKTAYSLFWRVRNQERYVKNYSEEKYLNDIQRLTAGHAGRLVVDYADLTDRVEVRALVAKALT